MEAYMWTVDRRPGYFGRRRDEIVAGLDAKHGKGNWQLRWLLPTEELGGYGDAYLGKRIPLATTWDFHAACVAFYEESYFKDLAQRPHVVEQICQFAECYDNAMTNIQSGMNYTKQEAFSTHIQDIAIRCVLNRLNKQFVGPRSGEYLQVRGPDSKGWALGVNPGQVPFFNQSLIFSPSLSPTWAQKGSVEDFWQSNKFILTRG